MIKENPIVLPYNTLVELDCLCLTSTQAWSQRSLRHVEIFHEMFCKLKKSQELDHDYTFIYLTYNIKIILF